MKNNRIRNVSLVVLVLLTLFFLNASRTMSADNAEEDLAQLKKLNARFIHNFVTNDVPSHDQIIHEDFVSITTKGARVNRKDYLTAWATGFDNNVYKYWDYRDQSIRVFGSFALVSSVNKWTVILDGKEVTGMTRYTDTYVKEKGEWKCVQAQLTSVSPENYPADETIVKKYVHGQIQ